MNYELQSGVIPGVPVYTFFILLADSRLAGESANKMNNSRSALLMYRSGRGEKLHLCICRNAVASYT